MSEVVVDASIVICWFGREVETPAANQLIRSRATLLAPSLLFAELANGLWKKMRRGEMGADYARAAMNEIRRFIPEFVETGELAPQALELAGEIGHSVYDCFYLALARRRIAPLVTLDRALIASVAKTPYARDIVHLADWV